MEENHARAWVLPHGIVITPANVGDRAGTYEIYEKYKENLGSIEQVMVDGGYSGSPFQEHTHQVIGATVEVVKRNELHTFAVIPIRWVVERSFAWLEKCRRLWKNCERLMSSSKGMVQLAFIRLLLMRRKDL